MATILIVDGHKINRQIYARTARRVEEDISVVTKPSAQEALLWLEMHVADLIIADFKLPDMGGGDFIGAIRAMQGLRDTPIIVVTPSENRGMHLRALDAGATDFLLSPVDHREFVARARNHLKMHLQSQMLSERADELLESLKRSESILARTQQESETRLHNVINTLPVMVGAVGPDGRILFMNECAADFWGISPEEAVGKDRIEIFGKHVAERNDAINRLVISAKTNLRSFEEELTGADGTTRIFMTTKSPLLEGDQIVGVVSSSQDITDRKAAETHLHHMAHHDALTGLANRSLMRDRVDREIGRCRRGDGRFAIHLIDLDGFKQVNDINGHMVGDELLISVGNRLKRVIGEGDLVARLGGDEFAILQSHVKSDFHIEQMGRAIINALPGAIEAVHTSTPVTASVGIAVHPEDGEDFEKLVRNADLAMYRSKAADGNGYCFFAANMDARVREEQRLDDMLRRAIVDERFELFYQPQVDLKTGSIVGCEALLRMRDEEGQLVMPGAFLARAERNGLIMPINEWVLQQACRQGAEWQRRGLPDFTIGVNLSPVQFQRQSVPLMVARILGETGMSARLLDLELTESIMLHDREAVAIQLSQLKDLGVKVSIDDYGTGASSLSYVKHFPVDRLKIDQSFVRDMNDNPSDAAIVKATINLGHSLGLQVIAEGVENKRVADLLLHEHCDLAQGYHYSVPLCVSEFEEFLATFVQTRHMGRKTVRRRGRLLRQM